MSEILCGSDRVLLVMTVARVHLVLWEPVDSQEWWDSLDPKEPMWVFRWTGIEIVSRVSQSHQSLLNRVNLESLERKVYSVVRVWEWAHFLHSHPLSFTNPSVTLTMYIFWTGPARKRWWDWFCWTFWPCCEYLLLIPPIVSGSLVCHWSPVCRRDLLEREESKDSLGLLDSRWRLKKIWHFQAPSIINYEQY